MNCPAYKKEARAHIYYYARCAVYVHDKCWQKHVKAAHGRAK